MMAKTDLRRDTLGSLLYLKQIQPIPEPVTRHIDD